MPEPNGRLKLSPGLAWTIAVALVAAGIAYGTLLNAVTLLGKDVVEIKSLLKEQYYTRSEIVLMKAAADNEHAEIRKRLDALEKTN